MDAQPSFFAMSGAAGRTEAGCVLAAAWWQAVLAASSAATDWDHCFDEAVGGRTAWAAWPFAVHAGAASVAFVGDADVVVWAVPCALLRLLSSGGFLCRAASLWVWASCRTVAGWVLAAASPPVGDDCFVEVALATARFLVAVSGL
mmetsp:Transcript_3903/g.11098  ORF Transcript_3903/g.11098 Transcript_3903/m.11098 type:complete len:146 (+) Transcript_3903:333-770(+)